MEGGSKWGSKEFVLKGMNFTVADKSLFSAVRMLNARTKQAFYAAIIKHGVLHRRTWNGCAYNRAAAEYVDIPVRNILAAAQVFECTPAVVRNFIRAWDTSWYANDRNATRDLLRMLESVGIFNDPDTPTIEKRRLVVKLVHASTMTDAELLNEFACIVKNDAMETELREILESAEALLPI